MTPEAALHDIAARLSARGVRFALVGGLAVSVRAEVRFTQDVDLAVAVASDAEMESLVRDLGRDGFDLVAVVEQDDRKRLAIARLAGPSGVVIDLLAASSGIEAEIVAGATTTPVFADVPIARAEHLLAMKVLSMRDERLQDRIDALGLLSTGLDLGEVRRCLDLIDERGYARGQDLRAKLDALFAARRG